MRGRESISGRTPDRGHVRLLLVSGLGIAIYPCTRSIKPAWMVVLLDAVTSMVKSWSALWIISPKGLALWLKWTPIYTNLVLQTWGGFSGCLCPSQNILVCCKAFEGNQNLSLRNPRYNREIDRWRLECVVERKLCELKRQWKLDRWVGGVSYGQEELSVNFILLKSGPATRLNWAALDLDLSTHFTTWRI